jgi:hypothetical protein
MEVIINGGPCLMPIFFPPIRRAFTVKSDAGTLLLGEVYRVPKTLLLRLSLEVVCWVRDDGPLIRTRDDLLELIAHVLRLQLSYLSKDQALAVADTILRTFKAAQLSIRQRR